MIILHAKKQKKKKLLQAIDMDHPPRIFGVTKTIHTYCNNNLVDYKQLKGILINFHVNPATATRNKDYLRKTEKVQFRMTSINNLNQKKIFQM